MERVAVVESIVQLVADNDRQCLERVLVDTLCELIPGVGARLVRVDGRAVTLLARAGEPEGLDIPDRACIALAAAAGSCAGETRCAELRPPRGVPVAMAVAVPLTDEAGCTLLLLGGRRLGEANRKLAVGIATIFRNYVNALGASRTDGLTRLFNRKTFDEKLGEVITEANARHGEVANDRRHATGEQTWLAIADIDHFKRVNDTFGHVFGDEVLLVFSQLMRATFRRDDLLFRYGGEEFAIVLTRTDLAGAWAVLDRFREAVAATRIPQVGAVTCSIGFTRVGAGEVPTALFGRADQALYFAKQNGRNQVRRHEDLVEQGRLAGGGERAGVEPELF
ncbi:MAG: GGDEF domain-containing protein [Pseudomonadota bacterium]